MASGLPQTCTSWAARGRQVPDADNFRHNVAFTQVSQALTIAAPNSKDQNSITLEKWSVCVQESVEEILLRVGVTVFIRDDHSVYHVPTH